MQSDHGASHVVTGRIGIEAAVDRVTLVQQRLQPAWVGSGPRRWRGNGGGDEGPAPSINVVHGIGRNRARLTRTASGDIPAGQIRRHP